MAKISHMMAKGIAAGAASSINGGLYDTTITAAGTTKAGATLLTASSSYVSITSSGKGVQLAAMDQGDSMKVYNGGANALLVYTNGSDSFTNLSSNAGFTVSSMKGCMFDKVTSALVFVNYSK